MANDIIESEACLYGGASDNDLCDFLHKKVRVTNPKYTAHVRFRKSFYSTPPDQFLFGYRLDGTMAVVPRAFFFEKLSHRHHPLDIQTITERVLFPEPRLEMYDFQEEAADAFFALVNRNDEEGLPTDSIIVLPTSGGKTILGMFIAYHCDERTLVVVPTQEIEAAWREDLQRVFGLKPSAIGSIRANKFIIGDHFTIGSVQTLMNRPKEQWAHLFGLTIFDEVHKMSAVKFNEVAQNCASHLRVGLTATDKRKDGLMPMIRWHLGQNCYKDLTPRNSVPLIYHGVEIPFTVEPTVVTEMDTEYEWNDVLNKMEVDEYVQTVVRMVDHIQDNFPEGGILITCNRISLIDMLCDEMSVGYSIARLTGQTKGRKKLYQEIKDGEYDITIATQAIVATGASCPFWHHVIIASPFSSPETMEQLKGRPIRRDEENNKEWGHVWDFCPQISMLRNMFKARYNAVKPHMHHAEFHRLNNRKLEDVK